MTGKARPRSLAYCHGAGKGVAVPEKESVRTLVSSTAKLVVVI